LLDALTRRTRALTKRRGELGGRRSELPRRGGECVGLLGPNGPEDDDHPDAHRPVVPTAGEVWVLGPPFGPATARRIKARWAWCVQEDSLDPDLSVEKPARLRQLLRHPVARSRNH
jgi:ABC-type multidrug transport system ATPase subunit